jgi:hypothetical protein
MCLEGMEESGSIGLDDFVEAEKGLFFKDVDAFCISDNYWLSTTKPCITYGLRGLCYFMVEVFIFPLHCFFSSLVLAFVYASEYFLIQPFCFSASFIFSLFCIQFGILLFIFSLVCIDGAG